MKKLPQNPSANTETPVIMTHLTRTIGAFGATPTCGTTEISPRAAPIFCPSDCDYRSFARTIARVNTLWEELGRSADVLLDVEKKFALNQYLDALLEANRQLNLTRITDRAAAEINHVADALTLLHFLPRGPITLADVGSGGGVPGIPLAIVRPDANVLLVESTKKKAAFLRNAVQQLGLKNVEICDDRAEKLARTDQRESFDVVTARAVGALVWLAEWCLPLVTKGGKMLAMKGAKIHEELEPASRPIKLLGGGAPVVHPVALPGTEHHVIVEILKIAQTDGRYPRNPTTTGGNPLK